MLFSRILPFGCLLVLSANAQSTTSTSESDTTASSSRTVLSGSGGLTEAATPTGSYISYASTITVPTATPITTSEILSTITDKKKTKTSTLGSTTIFGIDGVATSSMVGNATAHSNETTKSSTSTSTSATVTLLQGASTSTLSLNGTSNSTATSTSSSAQATNTTPCNNYPEFCSRKYSNITEVAAHNSPFVKAGNAAANQALTVTTQLNDGIRLLQGQMHFVNSTPHFCHTSCDILDAGPITDYLTTLYGWISTHPYDVVTLILENGDYAPVTNYTSFIESTGLMQYAYVPPVIPMGLDDWPTLASMILTGKRLVIFMDYDANQTAVPWILDEFSQMWETPFDPTDSSFPCTAQRPPSLTTAQAQGRMYMTNHNLNYDISLLGNSLLVPDIPLLNVTNNVTGNGSLGVGAQTCFDQWGYAPKFLNVDYYNVGNGSVFEVAAKYNNVTYTRSCCGLAVSGARALDVLRRGEVVAMAAGVMLFGWLLL